MTTETQGPGTSLAVRPPRAIVEDVVPIFDTNDFEHMQRIAGAMAVAPLVPQALKGNSLVEAQANCLMVVNQARNWRMDPFAVAQCCFVTKGKLGYEGKLVAAVIKSRLATDLHYWFEGTKGQDNYRVYVSDEPFTEELVAQLAPGKSYIGHRIIDGSVGEWKTTNDNWKQQPDMQLRYRGGRVWCRAYEPAILLGVYADDEVEEIAGRRERFSSGEPGAGGARAIGSGFGDETDQTFRRPSGSPQTAETGGGSSTAGESSEGPSASNGAAGGGNSQGEADAGAAETIQDAEFEPVGADASVDAGAQESAGGAAGQEARQEPVENGEVSEPGPDQGASGGDPNVIQGPAPAGEAYFFAGDTEITSSGRRRTYKDGLEFSAVSADNKKHKTYSEHAPRPTETGGAPSAEGAPASSGSAEGASSASAEATPGPSASSEPSSAGKEEREPAGETTNSRSPPSSAASPGPDDAFENAREEILRATSWLGIKQHLRTLAKSDAWRGAEDEAKRLAQAEAWDRYREVRNEGQESTNPVDDLSLFALWLQFGAQTADEVEGLFATFMRKPAYKDAKDGDKTWVRETVNKRLDQIRGGQ